MKNDSLSHYTHVQRMRDMDDSGVSPKGVDPNLRCRRKPVSAVAFGMYPSDLRNTFPFITTKDRLGALLPATILTMRFHKRPCAWIVVLVGKPT